MNTYWRALPALTLCLLLAVSPVLSAESYYNTASLKKLIQGKVVRLHNGGVIAYKRNGTYNFKTKGQNYPGKWRVTRNRVCVDFPNGSNRCDRYVKDGGTIYFENANGGRYKVRSVR